MTQLLADYLSFSGGANAGFSREILQSIASQIEAELYRSEVYCQAMTNLKTLPEDAGKQVQMMLKTVSKTAIRLALGQFVKQDKVVSSDTSHPTPDPQASVTLDSPELVAPAFVVARDETPNLDSVPTPGAANAVASVLPTSPDVSASEAAHLNKRQGIFKHAKRLTKAELAQLAIQEREERLRQIGQIIHQAREAKGLSLRQLYSLTKVPVHQLEALESGLIDRLPEDIYIRGFINRISRTLGLDGTSLVASIPQPDPVRSVVPSWYHPPTKSSKVQLHLNSVHLYIGYAALMAGGIAWLSQQSPPTSSVYPDINIPNDNGVQSSQAEPTMSAHQVSASRARMISNPEIAPPEALKN